MGGGGGVEGLASAIFSIREEIISGGSNLSLFSLMPLGAGCRQFVLTLRPSSPHKA